MFQIIPRTAKTKMVTPKYGINTEYMPSFPASFSALNNQTRDNAKYPKKMKNGVNANHADLPIS